MFEVLKNFASSPIAIGIAMGAIAPFLINILSGIILTIKNKFSETPKFDIGVQTGWSQLPASGSIFPQSVLVAKKLTSCTFVDISNGELKGKFTITKFRWMISSAAIIGMHTKKEAAKLLTDCNTQIKAKPLKYRIPYGNKIS